MKNLISTIFITALLFTSTLFAQSKEVPMPVGGMNALMENVVYPEKASKEGLQGKVILEVTVDETGDVTNAIVKKSADDLLDRAAIDAVMKTTFTPAEKNGEKVKASVVIPFQFKLDGKKSRS